MAAYFGRIGGWLYHQPYLLIAITYLTWALNIVLGRHISGTLPPVTLSIWRCACRSDPAPFRLAASQT